jgi:hypothetical protein
MQPSHEHIRATQTHDVPPPQTRTNKPNQTHPPTRLPTQHFRPPNRALADGLRREALPLFIDAAFVAPEDRPLYFRCVVEADMATRAGDGAAAAAAAVAEGGEGAAARGPAASLPRTFSHLMKVCVSVYVCALRGSV